MNRFARLNSAAKRKFLDALEKPRVDVAKPAIVPSKAHQYDGYCFKHCFTLIMRKSGGNAAALSAFRLLHQSEKDRFGCPISLPPLLFQTVRKKLL